MDEIDALRNEALLLLASIQRATAPLKELHIRHRAGWMLVLADRMERDDSMAMMDHARVADAGVSRNMADVFNRTPRPTAAQRHQR